jgi:spore germination cell wall hydrolase CwlJ-like protein
MTVKKSNGNPSKMVALSRNLLMFLGFVAIASVMVAVTSAKFAKLRDTNEPTEVVTTAERMKQLDCLSQNIYYEAGMESFEGKVAVAQVTMNRVEDGRFGKGVCGVIYQRNKVYEKVICQFSWACDGKSKVKPLNNAAYRESEEVAKKVLLEDFRLPGMKEAMYYHADYVNPGWGKPKVGKIGRHIFYKDKA